MAARQASGLASATAKATTRSAAPGPPAGAAPPPRDYLRFHGDSTIDGRTLRILAVVDEFTRKCLALYVARSIPAAKVISVLARVVAHYGAPEFIRSDNGPEFIAQAVCSWILFQGAQTHHIDPASPWQNAYGESFNARLRDECLNLEEFTSVVEAQVILDAWRKDYNTQREHSGIGNLSPSEFYAAWLAGQS